MQRAADHAPDGTHAPDDGEHILAVGEGIFEIRQVDGVAHAAEKRRNRKISRHGEQPRLRQKEPDALPEIACKLPRNVFRFFQRLARPVGHILFGRLDLQLEKRRDQECERIEREQPHDAHGVVDKR